MRKYDHCLDKSKRNNRQTLSSRLLAIAERVPHGAAVADIGTDHAYLPVYLIQNSIAGRVIASDVNSGPLDKALRNIKDSGTAQSIELRLGSGLEILSPGEVDTAVITGMGGLLIADILEKSSCIAREIQTFLLQPMNHLEGLRRYLVHHHYRIIDEVLVEDDGRIYCVMTVVNGQQEVPDEMYYKVGKSLVTKKDLLLAKYLENRVKELDKIICDIRLIDTAKTRERRKECEKECAMIRELLQRIKEGES